MKAIHESSPEWDAGAEAALSRFPYLAPSDRARLLEQARTLDHTRRWEGLDGLEVMPQMRSQVAVPACLLTLNIGLQVLADVTSIIIAPSSVIRATRHRVGGPIISEDRACVLGEALLHGPLRLAWDQVVEEATTRSTQSVVIHEFAHKIDMADGVGDGTPPIRERERSLIFEQVTAKALDELRDGNVVGPLRSYGAANRAELFAVASEAFFLSPTELHESSPSLYAALADFYRQDPAAGLGANQGNASSAR
jgi:Mlc titration factor MtfA (ptsG expression regulator)